MTYIPITVGHWINDTIALVLSDDDNTGDIDREGARETLVWLNTCLLRELKEWKNAGKNCRT